MSMYRKEWPCCGDVTETEAWEPEVCPFCTPAVPAAIASRLSQAIELVKECEAYAAWHRPEGFRIATLEAMTVFLSQDTTP